MPLHLSGQSGADALLDRDAFALLVGMLLDQQVPMEKAFAGPALIAERLGLDGLDPATVAAVPPDQFAAVMAGPPAVHRYPRSMGTRVQDLAAQVRDIYGGDVEAVWRDGDAATVLNRLVALAGFGRQKAKIFLALLGKQRGVRPEGWVQASAPYGEAGSYRSVADVVDVDSLARVRATKQALKASAKGAAGVPAKTQDRLGMT